MRIKILIPLALTVILLGIIHAQATPSKIYTDLPNFKPSTGSTVLI